VRVVCVCLEGVCVCVRVCVCLRVFVRLRVMCAVVFVFPFCGDGG